VLGGKKQLVQICGREFDLVKQGLSQSQVYAFITELINQNEALAKKAERLTFLERLAQQTVAEADELAANIRDKAQEEATKIIQMAEEEAVKIKTNVKEEVDGLLTMTRKRLESALKEKAKEVYQGILNCTEGIVAEVSSANMMSEVVEVVAQPASVPELGKEVRKPAAEESISGSYEGKVDLEILPPVDLAQFMKFRKELQHIPQLKITQIRSSSKEESRISTLITEPIPLLNVLRTMPEVHDALVKSHGREVAAPESQQMDHIERISIKLARAEQT